MSGDKFDYQRQAGEFSGGGQMQASEISSKSKSKSCATNQISADMWAGARKRHCESRSHLRSLLDKHLKPHQ